MPPLAMAEASPLAKASWQFLRQVAAGVGPVTAGLLAPGSETLPLPRRMEGFVCRLGDHD